MITCWLLPTPESGFSHLNALFSIILEKHSIDNDFKILIKKKETHKTITKSSTLFFLNKKHYQYFAPPQMFLAFQVNPWSSMVGNNYLTQFQGAVTPGSTFPNSQHGLSCLEIEVVMYLSDGCSVYIQIQV